MTHDVLVIHRLDLLLRIIDTASGNIVTDSSLEFTRNAKPLCPLEKDFGNFIFMNMGREDFILTISAKGFMEKSVPVVFKELSEILPVLEVYLIPNLQYQAQLPCHVLTGKIPDLLAVDAIKQGDSPCRIQGYDVEEHILTVFNPHYIELKQVFYALVQPSLKRYQPIVIKERLSTTAYAVSGKVPQDFMSYETIVPMIFAHVTERGEYRFCALNQGTDARYLFRFTTNKETYFKLADFYDDLS